MTMTNRRYAMVALITLGALAAVLVARAVLGSTTLRPEDPSLIDTTQPHREITGNPKSPDISFIESPSPTCSRPVIGTGACYIQWEYLYVTADTDAYVISMTVSIDDQLRAYHAGFFQTSMFIPGDMTSPGYRVTCGFPGSGELAEWGRTYEYTLQARDSNGLKASNSGTVLCPADIAKAFVPVIKRNR